MLYGLTFIALTKGDFDAVYDVWQAAWPTTTPNFSFQTIGCIQRSDGEQGLSNVLATRS